MPIQSYIEFMHNYEESSSRKEEITKKKNKSQEEKLRKLNKTFYTKNRMYNTTCKEN